MSTTTINFTMKDLDGTLVPFKTFEISSGRLNTGEIPTSIPPNVFFTTNEHGKATVTLTVTAAPYYIAKTDGATEKVIAYKFFVPESPTPLEAEMLYVDLGKKNQQYNDKTLSALIEAKVVTLNAANSAITIASMLGNMESIRNGIPNIIAVGEHIEDIGLLADNAANIASIGTNISNVNTVANNSIAINTVAANSVNIASVAQSISNVDSVVGMSSNISAVLSNATNINTAASAVNNIGKVATNITSVNTVAASNASVLTTANNIAAITHVGNNIANVAAVGSNIASINSVNAMSADIDLIIADMDAVVDAAAAVTQSIDAQKQLYIAGTDYTKNSTSQLVLNYFPAKPNSIKIFFDGVYQNKDKWSLFAKTIIFGLPISSNAVEVHYEVPSQFVGLSVEEQTTLATAQTNTLANANNATAQRAAAEAAKLAAESARDTAVSSASSATASASTATSAANAASTAASTATTQASNASTFATNAANSALSASGSAIAAASSASEAQTTKTDIEAIVATIPDGTINDSITSLIDVWSSTKVNNKFDEKQATLISGTNIKTLNGNSLLGSGDIVVVTESPSPYEVGDLLLTNRTLTAPAWLPADGAIYSQSSYAALYAEVGLLPSSVSTNTAALVTVSATGSWKASAAQGTKVVLVSDGPSTAASYSTDSGATWTASTLPTANNWTAVSFGATGHVMATVTDATVAAYSTDSGATWASRTTPVGFKFIIYVGGLWIGIPATSTTSYYTSPSGDNGSWTTRTLPAAPTHFFYGAVAQNGTAVLCPGNYNNWVLTSTNGTTWTQRTTPITPTAWVSAAVNSSGHIYIFQYVTATAYISTNAGANWTPFTLPSGFSYMSAVAFGDEVFVVPTDTTAKYLHITGTTVTEYDMPSGVYGRGASVNATHVIAPRTTSANSIVRIGRYGYDLATQFAVPTVPTPTGVAAFIKA